MNNINVTPIGVIHSSLKSLDDCPLQGNEGAPEALVEIHAPYAEALQGVQAGNKILVITWLHAADRSVLKCYPRNETTAPYVGVFATRSPDRPNPLGLHPVKVMEVLDGNQLRVHPLEALDGTPVVDIKPDISAR
ncbi:tRNA (N6-threonylcarbamoyladenosine(37)-N6)-methyltransferase TrmO [Chryseolinea lacunae]|uniref:tRNA (N6-threonylcarbamoyladenosine(37)-N6)-methyltransferase TrmO n=1 Tax=Chryseolinea lacunae TaxID=2801331 RepID=A0ABS1KXI7_9BACT|nr:tRNA (N6-threonylcarbamoyladenosine(37)-N6)-methyltransferase TrmO [Chryseolinea lacunae]MBL0743937.1 tRNA (N6-threonylcarbamoyladenosine(37)-N6)-methyltransferase TrmO [Chryseolinea lacunae]